MHIHAQNRMKDGFLAVLLDGMRDGFPIGLGYFAVAFSLGIAAGGRGLRLSRAFWPAYSTTHPRANMPDTP